MRVGKSRDLFQVQEIYDEEGESVRAQRRSAAEPFSVQFESRSTFHVRPGGWWWPFPSGQIANVPIRERTRIAGEYEEFLKRIAELAKKVAAGQSEETPVGLNTPGKRALYNNLNRDEGLALRLDEAVKTSRPDAWRGVQAREMVIKAAIYQVSQNVDEVERIFPIIKAQREY